MNFAVRIRGYRLTLPVETMLTGERAYVSVLNITLTSILMYHAACFS